MSIRRGISLQFLTCLLPCSCCMSSKLGFVRAPGFLLLLAALSKGPVLQHGGQRWQQLCRFVPCRDVAFSLRSGSQPEVPCLRA